MGRCFRRVVFTFKSEGSWISFSFIGRTAARFIFHFKKFVYRKAVSFQSTSLSSCPCPRWSADGFVCGTPSTSSPISSLRVWKSHSDTLLKHWRPMSPFVLHRPTLLTPLVASWHSTWIGVFPGLSMTMLPWKSEWIAFLFSQWSAGVVRAHSSRFVVRFPTALHSWTCGPFLMGIVSNG